MQRVKNRQRTGLAAEGESPYHRLNGLMDDVDYRGQPRTIEQRLAAVQAIDASAVRDYLEHYPIHDKGYFVSVGPRDWPPIS